MTSQPAPSVRVLGSGALGQAIRTRLAGAGFPVTDEEAGGDLVVWAAEDVPFARALELNRDCLRSGTPAAYVVCHEQEVMVGPLVVPGSSPCLACAHTEDAVEHRSTTKCPASLIAPVVDDLVRALVHAASPDSRAEALFSCQRHHVTHGGARSSRVVARSDCAACRDARLGSGHFELGAAIALSEAPLPAATSGSGPRLGVGVIGGGTAGYLAALALQQHRPDLEVTVVASSRVPVVGVGEATTPDLVEFLHRTLGIDELELYRRVRPTWKLGIRFLWGPAGGRPFHHPFRGEHLLDAVSLARDQDLQSLGAKLMAEQRAPVLRDDAGRIVSLLSKVPYAYHLDNAPLVSFLDAEARRRGIPVVEFTADQVTRSDDGDVDRLRADDGAELSFDFYVDATGFRSLLIGEALEVPFESYASTLFSDMAVVAEKSNGGNPAPYTLAETMDAGWCWSIPTRDEDHRGYVFSSGFISADDAEAEMRRADPQLGEARLVRFRSGRRRECWRGNVFALGNSYGFVEPLESTALHMVIHQIQLLVSTLPVRGEPALSRARVNQAVGGHWDLLRGFLGLHFRFNKRRDTPFWRACQSDVELGAGAAMLEAFREGAPLSARPDRDLVADSLFGRGFFGLLGIDNVLLGQQVETRLLQNHADPTAFNRWVATGLPAILRRALPHAEALEAYEGLLSHRS